MNLKIIFLCINTVTAVTAHNHLRHKPEQNQITSFQNTKGELSRLLLLKGSERLLGGSKDLGSCSKDNDCGDNQECKSSSQEDEDGECECENGYEVVDGVCQEEVSGGSGEGAATAEAKILSKADQDVLDCLIAGAKDALDEDDEDDVAENLADLISSESDGCGVASDQLACVEECNADIVDECDKDLRSSGNSNPSHDYDDCEHLDNDLEHCYEDCYGL